MSRSSSSPPWRKRSATSTTSRSPRPITVSRRMRRAAPRSAWRRSWPPRSGASWTRWPSTVGRDCRVSARSARSESSLSAPGTSSGSTRCPSARWASDSSWCTRLTTATRTRAARYARPGSSRGVRPGSTRWPTSSASRNDHHADRALQDGSQYVLRRARGRRHCRILGHPVEPLSSRPSPLAPQARGPAGAGPPVQDHRGRAQPSRPRGRDGAARPGRAALLPEANHDAHRAERSDRLSADQRQRRVRGGARGRHQAPVSQCPRRAGARVRAGLYLPQRRDRARSGIEGTAVASQRVRHLLSARALHRDRRRPQRRRHRDIRQRRVAPVVVDEGADFPGRGDRGADRAGHDAPAGGRALLRPARSDARRASGGRLVLRRRRDGGGPGARGRLRSGGVDGGLRRGRPAHRRDRHPEPREPDRAAGRADRRGAPARIPGPGDPGARPEAHTVARGPGRDPRGRADAGPVVTRVYLSLGSNVGDRLAVLRSAVRRLYGLQAVRFVDASPLYDSEPWESEPGQTAGEQRWYLNCVVAIDTSLPPRALLAELQTIESAFGRTRPPGTPEAQRFAPRTLDIDILFYGDQVLSAGDDLQIPHLFLAERGFVLRPLADLAPELEHPALYRSVRELLAELVDEHDVRAGAYPARWFED